MRINKRRKLKITKGERLLYTGAIFCFAMIMVLEIFCGAGVNHLSMNVEKMRYEIEEQEKKNESLVMKVNELTSFDKIKDVVSDMGLAYNNDNIVVISN